MNKFSIWQVAGLSLIVVLILGVLLNKLLFLSCRKGKDKFFKDLSSYFPIFKKGWQVVYKNLWIFWILFGFRVLASLQQNLFQYVHYKSKFPNHSFFTLFSFNYPNLGLFFQGQLKKSFLTFQSVPIYLSVIGKNITSIVLLLLIIFFIKRFKRFLSQPFSSECQPSVDFLKKNFHPFIIATVILLIFQILTLIFPSQFSNRNVYFNIPTNLVGMYWHIIVNSLLVGLVLTLFKESIFRRQTRKDLIFISSLKFFRHLFFFYLFLAVFSSFCFTFPVYFLREISQISLRIYRIIQPAVLWILLIFIFIPYLIVAEDTGWTASFRNNFQLWKRNFPQICSLFFIVILLTWVVHFLLSPLYLFGRTHFFFFTRIISDGVTFLLSFWMTAVILLFCLKVKESNIVKSIGEKEK